VSGTGQCDEEVLAVIDQWQKAIRSGDVLLAEQLVEQALDSGTTAPDAPFLLQGFDFAKR
jgi:hypothetical protein